MQKGKTKLDNQLHDILQYIQSGETITNIAHIFNTNRNSIYKLLKIQEIETKNIKFNQNFFHTINTEEKAYWLGFMYADGNTLKSHHRITIGLKKTDENHLYK